MTRLDEVFTPSELWDHVEQEPRGLNKGDGTLSYRESSEWYGGMSWAEAKNAARNGWPEGLAKIAPVLARVDELIAHALPENVIAWDVTGETPDVGALLSGVPENMMTTEEAEGAARMVRVLVNVGASCAVSASTIEARGTIACALVDALERAGYRCEVLAGWVQETRGYTYTTRALIKRAEEPLALDRIVFTLVHPSFMRRILFRCMELIPNKGMRDSFLRGNSYGCPSHMIGQAGDIVIGELYGTNWTPDKCADEVKRYLQEVGVHMTDAKV